MLALMIAFGVVIGLIRLQPFDNTKFRAVLMPDDCASPCFMGIQPGVTTLRETLVALERHPWATNIENETTITGYRIIMWDWSGEQPPWIDATQKGYIGLMNDRPDSRVQVLRMSIFVPLGHVWLLHGRPDTTHWELTAFNHPKAINHRLIYQYDHADFSASTVLDCPLQPRDYWGQSSLHVEIAVRIQGGYEMSLGNLVRRCR
jgi:hypothetical protein